MESSNITSFWSFKVFLKSLKFVINPCSYLEFVNCSLRTRCPLGFLRCTCRVCYQSGARPWSSESLKAKQWTWGGVRGEGQRDGENTTSHESLKIYNRCVLESVYIYMREQRVKYLQRLSGVYSTGQPILICMCHWCALLYQPWLWGWISK